MTALAKLLRPAATMRALRESALGLVALVRQGLPTALVDRLVASGWLTMSDVDRLIVSRRTLSHRKQHRQPLSADESDRLARVLRVLLLVEETFQNPAKAVAWLRRRNRALQGSEPLALLDTDGGARAVETVLGRLAHGVYA